MRVREKMELGMTTGFLVCKMEDSSRPSLEERKTSRWCSLGHIVFGVLTRHPRIFQGGSRNSGEGRALDT